MYLHMQVFINIVASLSDSRQTGVSIEFGTGFFSEQRAIHGRLAIAASVAFDSRVVKPGLDTVFTSAGTVGRVDTLPCV